MLTRIQQKTEGKAAPQVAGHPEQRLRIHPIPVDCLAEVEKIARVAPALGLTRFVLKYSSGTLPHADLCRCIELYATEVVPRVRALVAATR